jgi:hypothetical protein
MFSIGQFVKGNNSHIHAERMDDVGVVIEDLDYGYMVAWFSDKSHHYAPPYELEAVDYR